MIWFLLGLHAVAIAVLVSGVVSDRHRPMLIAGVAPGATAVWGAVRLAATDAATAEATWVAALDLELAFRVGPLAALMTVIVSGIGCLVFIYGHGYFGSKTEGTTRFAATLLLFSASMLGLVWADSVWTLFLFWELTSVSSFLLVGHKHAAADVRKAARRALLVTAAGGLALLGGLVVLVDAAGVSRLSSLGPVEGNGATVAAILLMIGAATKSAQVPFHVWLPGAMAAPTPVSAYLHSATMVKAGVLLVAIAGPAFVDVPVWKVVGLSLGIASMLWGGWGALRHHDAKLILAWGTISQLGLLITLFAAGSGKATFAAVSILAAHAIFKAALFMVVGEVDVRTGTRDIRELHGLARSMPLGAAVAVVSGLSMAGVPPLLGFPAKEAAIEAGLGLDGGEGLVVTVAIVAGSVLTVAYTARLLLGLFGSGSAAPTPAAPRRPAMTVPALILGAGSLLGYLALGTVTEIARDAAIEVNASSAPYSLLRWPGLTLAFGISVAIVAAGSLVGVWAHRGSAPAPDAVGARAVDRGIDAVIVGARRLTGHTQHGSLPVYLATMAATASVAAAPFLAGALDADVRRWDTPMQAVLAVAIVAAAVPVATLDSRLGAALGLGLVGLGVAGMFVVHGAPDLVLTQLLVETVVVVGFVVGLGHLGRRFPPVAHGWRAIRIVVAAFVGVAVAVGLLAASSAPSGTPPVETFVTEAVDTGGGNNVVNVILTDIRALDTLGEVLVLVVVGTGILSLARPRRGAADTDPDEGAEPWGEAADRPAIEEYA